MMPSSPSINPGLLPALASLFCVAYTVGYVGILYVSALTRPRPGLPRDSPLVIRSRVRAVTVVSALAVVLSSAFVVAATDTSWNDAFSTLGLWPINASTLVDAARSLLLTLILFVGPLIDRVFFRRGGWRDLKDDARSAFYPREYTWVGWRNFVAAPVTEELVFRACMIPLHIIAGRSATSVVFLSPLYFGIAHVHHAYEFYVNHKNAVLAAVRSAVQFTYTTIFGWYATFLLVRTGSVWPVVLVHSFCNWIGVPNLKVDGPAWMSAVYYPTLVAGAYGFYKLLWPLTDSDNALMRL